VKGLQVAMDYLHRLYAFRYFLFSLVRNDLSNRYRRSFLGVAWSMVKPVGMTLILCFVFRNVFSSSEKSYAPFVLVGVVVWVFIVESMVAGCTTFKTGATYIRQQPIPMALFPLRTILVVGFHSGISFLLAMALAWYSVGLPPLWVLASVLPGVVLLFLLGLSFAAIFGALQTHFPDTQHVIEIGLQGLFYLTPVLYRPDFLQSNRFLSRVIYYNPFTSILELIRRPLLQGSLAGLSCWLVVLGFVAVIGLTAFLTLRKVQRELVFWI
jgi:ABC-type polysaccharide/polyol phosphate export permease